MKRTRNVATGTSAPGVLADASEKTGLPKDCFELRQINQARAALRASEEIRDKLAAEEAKISDYIKELKRLEKLN